MEVVDKEALETLISITGVTEAVGTSLLQATGGDLNAAVNAFLNEGEEFEPARERNEVERNDYMEEDDPIIDVPIGPTDPVVPVPAVRLPGVEPWDRLDFGAPSFLGRPVFPTDRGSAPRVSHPREVRDVPIDWRDEEPTFPSYGPSTVRIEELPDNVDTQHLQPIHTPAMVDEEVPNADSSLHRPLAEQSGARRYPSMMYPGPDMNPENPSAPRIAEVPVTGSEDGIDIEEEMLRAAIEASRREAENASKRSVDPLQDVTGVNGGERFPTVRSSEDDDLARAVTLSLKTAEQEKAMRERVGASSDPNFMEENEDNPSEDDIRRLDSMRRRGIARDRAGLARTGPAEGVTTSGRDKGRLSGSSSGAIISSAPDDAEEVEEQPLLRRRTSRRSIPVTAEAVVLPDGAEARASTGRGISDQRESSVFVPSVPASDSVEEGVTGANLPSQRDVDAFPSDEWGGISSQEHDEAVMLEAALFGGLPEGSGLGLPYHGRRNTDVFDDIPGVEAGGRVGPYSRRSYQQPPSPTVVAQRLLREQQDDEYLASLAADREKELKAIQEAEEAARAAESEEILRREEELRQKAEAEELERQLNAKKGKLPMEPPPDAEDAVTLVVRLPDGSRRGRRFYKSNKLQNLFDFIDVGGGVKPGSYRLVRQFPRVAFTDGEHSSSLESLGLTSKQEVLLLELI
ncbi:hypothetical protein R1sor_003946 [Riccia sorocarpa]|uniref:UBX domain-containing protein n=1 Tax=Riccia sorocarpa TaxID=122646 RepID=A0ABD3H978_9MARC